MTPPDLDRAVRFWGRHASPEFRSLISAEPDDDIETEDDPDERESDRP